MSTLLDLAQRPWTRFDVQNRRHREIYADFLVRRNWGRAPVRFYIEPGYDDLVSMIESKLSWYYLSKETKQKIPTREDSWYTS